MRLPSWQLEGRLLKGSEELTSQECVHQSMNVLCSEENPEHSGLWCFSFLHAGLSELLQSADTHALSHTLTHDTDSLTHMLSLSLSLSLSLTTPQTSCNWLSRDAVLLTKTNCNFSRKHECKQWDRDQLHHQHLEIHENCLSTYKWAPTPTGISTELLLHPHPAPSPQSQVRLSRAA